MKYQAISLWQPWASLIALGVKRFETRSWTTNYRGPLVICAAKRWNAELKEFAEVFSADFDLGLSALPLGCALAVADLTRIYRTEDAAPDQSARELAFGDWSPGRYCWRMDNVRPFPEPIPVKGAQGLFTVELELEGMML